MGWFEIGFFLGLFVYGIIIGALVFQSKFREWFYSDVFEDTILGESGEYLFFPDEHTIENSNAADTFVSVMALIGIHLALFAVFIIVFTLVGAILFPFIVLGVFIGPIVYYFVKRKRKKQLALLQKDE